MIVGYARTSTSQQLAGFEAQMKLLKDQGCEMIFSEQVSSLSDRTQLEKALEFVRSGDTFVVTALDRLARSVQHLVKIVDKLSEKQVSLKILNLNIDTNTPTGKMLLTMMGAIAQFEREIMLERQKEGIAKASALGRFRGRKAIPSDVAEEIKRLAEGKLNRKTIAKMLKISVSSVYKVMRESRKNSKLSK